MLDFFTVVMQAKVSMLISGGSGSGKTTLARMIVELTPATERLVIVGETGLSRILQVEHERMVCLEQPASGDISAGELLRLARHMRPDRIVYGELEGSEALDVLRLANRGHDGIVATIHAESPRDALYRLETMITTAEPSLTLPAIRAQVAGALGLIVQQSLLEDGTRKITSICEVQGIKGDTIILQDIFVWEQTSLDDKGRLIGTHKATGAIPSFVPALAAAGLTFPEGTFEP
jgi:pilus assembly protein CpaF